MDDESDAVSFNHQFPVLFPTVKHPLPLQLVLAFPASQSHCFVGLAQSPDHHLQ